MTTHRNVELTFAGAGEGAIRAMLPHPELRERLKPFVFLDDVEVTQHTGPWGFAFHPHSGVATFTYLQVGDLEHEDTGGNGGTVSAGSVQWMAAGGGIWHQEYYQPVEGRVSALQLWVVLPPELEDADVGYQMTNGTDLPVAGNTRVLSGRYADAQSPIETPYPFNYFDVELGPGESWSFSAPSDHDVAWAYNHEGELVLGGEPLPGKQLVVFERSSKEVAISAGEQGARFVFGSAKQTPWPIVAHRGSMHTNSDSLERGSRRIQELGRELQESGRL